MKNAFELTQEELDLLIDNAVNEIEAEEEEKSKLSLAMFESDVFQDFLNHLTPETNIQEFIAKSNIEDIPSFYRAIHHIDFEETIQYKRDYDSIHYARTNNIIFQLNSYPTVVQDDKTVVSDMTKVARIYELEAKLTNLVQNDIDKMAILFTDIELSYLQKELDNIKENMYQNDEKNFAFMNKSDFYYEGYDFDSEDILKHLEMFNSRI